MEKFKYHMMFEELPEELPVKYYIFVDAYINCFIRISVYATTLVLSDDIETFKSYSIETCDRFTHVADLYPNNIDKDRTMLKIESGYNFDLSDIIMVRLDDQYEPTTIEISKLI